MKTIKKIQLNSISERFSEMDMKQVMGGVDFTSPSGGGAYPCNNKECSQNSDCGNSFCSGTCRDDGTKRCL
jgi:hypothetical protein